MPGFRKPVPLKGVVIRTEIYAEVRKNQSFTTSATAAVRANAEFVSVGSGVVIAIAVEGSCFVA